MTDQCYSCEFERKCIDYKGVMLCARCFKEAHENAKGVTEISHDANKNDLGTISKTY